MSAHNIHVCCYGEIRKKCPRIITKYSSLKSPLEWEKNSPIMRTCLTALSCCTRRSRNSLADKSTSIFFYLFCLYLSFSCFLWITIIYRVAVFTCYEIFTYSGILGLCHAKTCLLAYTDSEDPDEPAYVRRLIKAFTVH